MDPLTDTPIQRFFLARLLAKAWVARAEALEHTIARLRLRQSRYVALANECATRAEQEAHDFAASRPVEASPVARYLHHMATRHLE